MKQDTYSHKGWITSDIFIKRVIAIWLHSIVIPTVIMILMLIYVMS